MRSNLFWLDDKQWQLIEPHLPTDVRGKERVDDRRVISGILHVLRSGCRWKDCPPEYGPHTTVYNRFVRWAERGIWERLFRELASRGRSTATQMTDSTHIKAHRSASGGKGGSRNRRLAAHVVGAIRRSTQSQMLEAVFFLSCRPAARRTDCPPAQRLIRRNKAARKLLADKAYDSAELRQWLKDRGTKAVVPNGSNRKQPFSFDKKSYRQRHRIENAFCRLKDFRRIATRYDRLARNFLASVCLVAAILWGIL